MQTAHYPKFYVQPMGNLFNNVSFMLTAVRLLTFFFYKVGPSIFLVTRPNRQD